MTFILAFLAVALTVRDGHGQAPATEPAPAAPRLDVTLEASHLGNTGNSNNSSTGIGAGTTLRDGSWTLDQRAVFSRGRANGVITAQSLTYRFAASRTISPHLTTFGEFRYLRDVFSGLRQQRVPLAGLSLSLINTPRVTFAVRGAAGVLNERRVDGNILTAAAGSGARYRWQFARGPRISGDALAYARLDNPNDWRVVHTVETTFDLTSVVAFRVGHGLRYAHAPVGGAPVLPRARLDTTSTLSIVARLSR